MRTFWSYEAKQIVYRAYPPQTGREVGLFGSAQTEFDSPNDPELWVMTPTERATTSERNGKANFGPYFFSGRQARNLCFQTWRSKGRNFDLYKINVDGTGLERITFNDTSPPMDFNVFTRWQEARFCFESQRETQGETNVFMRTGWTNVPIGFRRKHPLNVL